MPHYKQGEIYTVRCKLMICTLIYVGCTTQSLCERMAKHRYDSIKNPTICFYQYINDWNDWYIKLYENYPCENKEQLNKREGEIIREIGTVNEYIAGRTLKEYYEDNKEKRKEYRETNKDKIKSFDEKRKENRKEYKKEYYQRKKQEAKNTPKQIR